VGHFDSISMVGGCHDSESGVPISRTRKAVCCKHDALEGFVEIRRVSCGLVVIQYEVYTVQWMFGRTNG
jgi:hypothetical protein